MAGWPGGRLAGRLNGPGWAAGRRAGGGSGSFSCPKPIPPPSAAGLTIPSNLQGIAGREATLSRQKRPTYPAGTLCTILEAVHLMSRNGSRSLEPDTTSI